MTVSMDSKPVEAMIYIMNDGRPIGTPRDFYCNAIAEGYASAGFDTDILYKAFCDSKHLASQEKCGDCLRCSHSLSMEDQFDYGADRLFCAVKQDYVEENDCCKEFN